MARQVDFEQSYRPRRDDVAVSAHERGRQSLTEPWHGFRKVGDVMDESYQSVTGQTPQHAPQRAGKLPLWLIAMSAVLAWPALAGAGVAPHEVVSALAIPSKDVTSSGNAVAAGNNPIPNINSHQFEARGTSSADFVEPGEPLLLMGLDADSLLGQPAISTAAVNRAETAAVTTHASGAGPAAQPRPVTIPFPTAAHLFIPGAALALYAARKISPRYRRQYRTS